MASCAKLHRCRFEAMAFAPQKMISFASAKDSIVGPVRVPSVRFIASAPAAEQIVRTMERMRGQLHQGAAQGATLAQALSGEFTTFAPRLVGGAALFAALVWYVSSNGGKK